MTNYLNNCLDECNKTNIFFISFKVSLSDLDLTKSN